MDIKYLIENKYMKCVLQINGFSGPVSSSPVQLSSQVRSGGGGGGATRSIHFSYQKCQLRLQTNVKIPNSFLEGAHSSITRSQMIMTN